MSESDTIYALSSGHPPAAIAVIRISGPRAHTAGEALAGALPAPRHAVLRRLHDQNGALLDEALVLRFDSPASATGEDLVELQCHGGRAVVAAVMAALAGRPGVRQAVPGEFTRRALINGRIDLTEAEGLADLLEAETEVQRRTALAAADGGVSRLMAAWRGRLIGLSARTEAAIDYVGDEDETALDPEQLTAELTVLRDEWRAWLDRPRSDLLRRGARVVLAGPPNAGKSTLFNAMVGSDKAIVTAVPGTTRDAIEAPLALNGVPLILVDTAGLRPSADPVEQIGVERSVQQVAQADVVLWLGEPAAAPSHPRLLLIHGQADRRSPAPIGTLPVSARTGEGMSALLKAVGDEVRDVLPRPDELSLNQRQADLLAVALGAIAESALPPEILASQLLRARQALDEIVGQSGAEEMLDSLFGRFCLGK